MGRHLTCFAGVAWLAGGALLLARGLPAFADSQAEGGAALAPVLSSLGALAVGALLLALLWRTARRRAERLRRAGLARRGLPRHLLSPSILTPLLVGAAALLVPPFAAELHEALALLALGLAVPAFGAGVAHLLPPRPPAATPPADLDRRPPIGVLLLDAEEPEAPRASAVRRHLRRVLGDRLTQPRRSLAKALWRRHVVAPLRAQRLAREYRRVWTAEGGPRTRADRRVARALAAGLGPEWRVAVAGPRDGGGLREAIDALLTAGCQEIRVVPLLPQYSVAATGTRIAELFRRLARRRLQPALRVETSLYRRPGFTRALALRVRETLGPARGDWDRIVIAFPGRHVALAADPYGAQCRATAEALARELELPRESWAIGFGDDALPGAGPEPRLSEVLFGLAAKAPRVLVVPAGTTTDGVETLHGLAVELAAAFQRAGGRELRVVTALNDHPAWIRSLVALVRDEPDGAPDGAPDGGDLRRHGEPAGSAAARGEVEPPIALPAAPLAR